MPAKGTKIFYGMRMEEDCDPIGIEMYCIRKGGQWQDKGETKGAGLFHHYKRLQQLFWPEEDDHRWSDLILKEILQNRITAIQGSKDCGKTHGISKFAIVDYGCFPDTTLILISSTDLRSLELRVWGDLKDLFMRAKKNYPQLPGKPVDHLQIGRAHV